MLDVGFRQENLVRAAVPRAGGVPYRLFIVDDPDRRAIVSEDKVSQVPIAVAESEPMQPIQCCGEGLVPRVFEWLVLDRSQHTTTYGMLMEYLQGYEQLDLLDELRPHHLIRTALCGNQSVRRVPENSSLSHFSAMTRPSWLGRAEKNMHCVDGVEDDAMIQHERAVRF